MKEINRIDIGKRMSQAVIHNGTIYLAGQVGIAGERPADQTRTILENIDRLLAQAGSDKSRILQATIWLSSMDYFAEMNEVWDAWVAEGASPARACGESALATPEYKVEIMIVAAQ